MRTEPSFSSEPDNLLSSDLDTNESAASPAHHIESQLLSDYRQRYGLSIDPFADDPHFPFYTGAQRRQVLDQLLHLSQFSHNLLVVLGEYGVGKTRMAQALIDALDDADDICFLEGQITSHFDSLFKNVLEQFELSDIQEFTEFTRRQSDNDGLAILLVDNAHHLTDAVLAELIGLIKSGAESRVHLVLFAEPHLLSRLDHLDVTDVVLSDLHLEKFTLTEATDYLNFRLEMADYLGPEFFTEPKVEVMYKQSRGQLLRLHDSAQDYLLASVSTPQSFQTSKNGFPVIYIVGAAILGAILLMGSLYWGGSSKTTDLPLTTTSPTHKIPEPSNPTASAIAPEPVLLHEGVNAIHVLSSAPTENNVTQNVASSVMPAVNITPQNVRAPEQEKIEPATIGRKNIAPVVAASTLNTSRPELPKANTFALEKAIKKQEAPQPVTKAASAVSEPRADKIKNTINTAGYSEQEKIILSWDEASFTLQVVGLSSEKAVRDYVAEQANKKDLLVFKSSRLTKGQAKGQAKDWYVVITGRFPSAVSAREAARLLPDSQRKTTPWPRDLKTIQREIRAK